MGFHLVEDKAAMKRTGRLSPSYAGAGPGNRLPLTLSTAIVISPCGHL